MAFVPSPGTPAWANGATAVLILVSPFGLIGAAMAHITRTVAAGLLVLGIIALIIGIIMSIEPDGILTGMIPFGGAGVILGVVAHHVLDRPRAQRDA